MYKPFEEMPPDARLWIYQSNRRFSSHERAVVETHLKNLCEEWSAHGAPLKTSFRIEFDQFIILAVDERPAGASGCSIDSSVRTLKALQQTAGLDFFDRQQVAFREKEVKLYPVSQLPMLFESGVLSGDSITFNNALTTKSDWEKNWKIPARESWLVRYLPKSAVRQQPH